MITPSPAQLAAYRVSLEKFVRFTDEEWSLYCEELYVRKLKKKELFVDSGKVCNEIAFIVSGSARFYFIKDGVEISNYFCFEGELITSYASFLRQSASPINIEVSEDTVLVCISHAGLRRLQADPRMAFRMEQFGRLVAEYLICCYEDRVLSFITQSPEERYLDLLRNQPELLARIPQHYLANYLGVTGVSLSRIRRRVTNQARTLKTLRA